MYKAKKGRLALFAAFVIAASATVVPAQASEVTSGAGDEAPGVTFIYPREAGMESMAEATFYPTGPIGEDTLIVVANPDGSLPGGLTEADFAAYGAARASGDLATMASVERAATESAVQAGSVYAPRASYSYIAGPLNWTSELVGSGIGGTQVLLSTTDSA